MDGVEALPSNRLRSLEIVVPEPLEMEIWNRMLEIPSLEKAKSLHFPYVNFELSMEIEGTQQVLLEWEKRGVEVRLAEPDDDSD